MNALLVIIVNLNLRYKKNSLKIFPLLYQYVVGYNPKRRQWFEKQLFRYLIFVSKCWLYLFTDINNAINGCRFNNFNGFSKQCQRCASTWPSWDIHSIQLLCIFSCQPLLSIFNRSYLRWIWQIKINFLVRRSALIFPKCETYPQIMHYIEQGLQKFYLLFFCGVLGGREQFYFSRRYEADCVHESILIN